MTFTKEQVDRWKIPTAEGFFAFVEDVQPQVPSNKGGFETWTCDDPEVRAEIEKALNGDFGTIIFCWPRRHGKTTVPALIIVWRFVTRITQTVALVANSEKQSVDTAFKLVKTILEQTPYLRRLADDGAIVIQVDKITYDALGNVIQGYAANPATLFGKKLSVAQVSELHATSSDAVYQAVASATIDTDDGVVFVDSTVGPMSSPLYGLYSLWKNGEDPAIFFSHIFYRTLEEALAKAPRWISKTKLKSRAKQMLPAEFEMQHLNKWGGGTSALFPEEVREKCKGDYALDPKTIADGRAYAVGGGLDRAYGFSLHGDATVTSCVMMVVENEEPHFYVLADDAVTFSSAGGIKKNLTRYRIDFGMSKAALESYNVQDVAAWAAEQPGLESETVFATLDKQSNAFTALYNAASEGRLHIHPKFQKLFSEMESFEYRLETSQRGTVAKFQHAKGAHDDHIYALAWAVYSLREIELNPYELKGVWCDAPKQTARLCILNGGELEPACAGECRSFIALRGMYKQHNSRPNAAEMGLNDFNRYKVVNIGTRTIMR